MMVETKISILNTCKIICKGLSIPPEMAAATFEIYSAPSKVEKVPRLPPFFRTFVFAFCIFASSILTSANERDWHFIIYMRIIIRLLLARISNH